MAVYTDINADELAAFLDRYDIGELLSYKGIAEGVENSNFLVHTQRGYFILTLYEKRVAVADLPFFLSLMGHLAARGINCPQPVVTREGKMLGTRGPRTVSTIPPSTRARTTRKKPSVLNNIYPMRRATRARTVSAYSAPGS
jgi:homoserine kinase type II